MVHSGSMLNSFLLNQASIGSLTYLAKTSFAVEVVYMCVYKLSYRMFTKDHTTILKRKEKGQLSFKRKKYAYNGG